jgi:predicted  nucleic acid-binding Zn-ribbon protein
MGELVVEKLTQKVSNMLDEIGDVNILIRRLTPTQETLNRINERVDAVFAALKQLEKGVQLDEKKLAQLEEQIALLKDWLESVKKTAGELVDSFKGTARELKASAQGLEVRVDRLGEVVKAFGEKSDGIRKGLDTHHHEEYRKWENNNKVLEELLKRLADLRVKGIILIVLVLMVLSFVLFRRG